MVDFRTNYAKDIAALVQETYGSQIAIFKNVIPMSVKAQRQVQKESASTRIVRKVKYLWHI